MDGRSFLAVFDREHLREWLASPAEMLASDEMAFAVAGQSVVVAVAHEVPWSRLAHRLLGDLRAQV